MLENRMVMEPGCRISRRSIKNGYICSDCTDELSDNYTEFPNGERRCYDCFREMTINEVAKAMRVTPERIALMLDLACCGFPAELWED